jgi:uncharacterized protein with NAD-binding domain and iron-sulfur cluster
MTASGKRRIAVLGGGIGALAAVFKLTQQPNWQDRFDITVYQLGWRLGGKGASGRNAQYNDRIEEHGLHVWAGFYENAFQLMNAVYKDYVPPASPAAPFFCFGPMNESACPRLSGSPRSSRTASQSFPLAPGA